VYWTVYLTGTHDVLQFASPTARNRRRMTAQAERANAMPKRSESGKNYDSERKLNPPATPGRAVRVIGNQGLTSWYELCLA
jgi:hypothetical protein